jgi:hypothetical protein
MFKDIEKKTQYLLHNKNVLYVVFFISIVMIFYYLVKNEINYIIVFLIIGFLTSFYSKNMIIILLVSIVITVLIKHINFPKFSEGMDDKSNTVFNDENTNNPTQEDNVGEIGPDGIDRIQEQTKQLLETQKILSEKVNKIQPLLEKANKMIDEFKTMKMENMQNKNK